MDRLAFLKSMLGNAALLTLPPLELLPKEDQDRLAWTSDCHLIFIYDTYIRGIQHHQGPALINNIHEHDILDLVREYDNEHDVNAVAVYWEGNKLGYLPMFENLSLAYMLDHGLLLECHVIYTQPKAPSWEQCFIAIDLLVPRNPSFDSYIHHYMARPDAGYRRRPEFDGDAPIDSEPSVQSANGTTLRNGHALAHLSIQRFNLFMQAVAEQPQPPTSVTSFLQEAQHEGLYARCQRIGNGGCRLSLRIIAPDHFRIRYGYAQRNVGDGGEWLVWFNPDGTVHRLEPLTQWIV